MTGAPNEPHHRPDLRHDDTVRRLRIRPLSFWTESRTTAVRTQLQLLADLVADAEGRQRRTVPPVHPLALAEQLAVLVGDAARSGVDPAAVTAAVAVLDGVR